MADEGDEAQVLADHFHRLAVNTGLAEIRVASTRAGKCACDDCHETIDPARIRAVPHAVRCAECQTEAERRGHLGRGA